MDWLLPVREVFGFVFPFLERLPVIRGMLGFLLVFFLPGFAWTFIFFKQLSVLERITLSFALSLVLVTLSLLAANRLAHIRISGINSVPIIIVVTVLPVILYYLNRVIRGRKERAT